MLSPGGQRGRLTILTYHQVLEDADPLRPGEITRQDFAWQMTTLASCFHVLPLDEALDRLDADTLPPGAVAITFDDGYRNNIDRALPMLREFGLTATFFITTGTLGRYMWNDAVIEIVRHAPSSGLDTGPVDLGVLPTGNQEARVTSLYRLLRELKAWQRDRRDQAVDELLRRTGTPAPEGLMMSSADVRTLARAGMQVGAHTITHPILGQTTLAEARSEIAGGREQLEAITGEPVKLFAYPNGRPGQDYGAEHVALVRELGFRGSVSTAWGSNRRSSDRYQLCRVSPWDRTPLRFTARLLLTALRGPWPPDA